MRPNGAILWRGPSQLDGAPIVVILTGLADASANEKTGAMLQTWILRADVDPFDAVKSGQDATVCGDCKHRPSAGGACYVRVYQAPKSVWKAFHRGAYASHETSEARTALGSGRAVRIGSYGDPAAVPVQVWRDLLSGARMHTGYTHQWHKPHGAALRGIVMASADTPDEMSRARADGWRTFRVKLADEPMQARESVCPASAEAGHKVSCSDCGACNGAETGRKGSIAIAAHGSLAGRYIALRQAA